MLGRTWGSLRTERTDRRHAHNHYGRPENHLFLQYGKKSLHPGHNLLHQRTAISRVLHPKKRQNPAYWLVSQANIPIYH